MALLLAALAGVVLGWLLRGLFVVEPRFRVDGVREREWFEQGRVEALRRKAAARSRARRLW